MRGRKTKVKCLTTGEVFESIGDACLKYGIKQGTLSGHLRGRQKFCGIGEDGSPLTWQLHYDDIDWMVR